MYRLLGVLMCCATAFGAVKPPQPAFELLSPSIKNGQPLGAIHSWKDHNEAPILSWNNAPKGTKSFALICDDPDAPAKTWVHWVVYNIPGSTTEIAEPLGRKKKLKDGTMQGINDFEKIGYDGPYPPIGKAHRYFFKLYALDTLLDLKEGATKAELEAAMEGHILASAQIMGTYARKAPEKKK